VAVLPLLIPQEVVKAQQKKAVHQNLEKKKTLYKKMKTLKKSNYVICFYCVMILVGNVIA